MEQDKTDYNKMKEDAGEFAKWLIKTEQTFKQEITDCDSGLAVYFDINSRDNKVVTIFFKENGYVGIEVKED
jgi:hypothetical protein